MEMKIKGKQMRGDERKSSTSSIDCCLLNVNVVRCSEKRIE